MTTKWVVTFFRIAWFQPRDKSSLCRYVLDDREMVNSLAALCGGELRGHRSWRWLGRYVSSQHRIGKTLAAWCCWTSRRSVMAIRLWQPEKSME